MCECFKKAIDLVKKDLEGKNEVSVKWQNAVMFWDGKDHAPTVLNIKTEYRRTKTNGEKYRNLTKNSISVVLKYCPMCGERIEEIK